MIEARVARRLGDFSLSAELSASGCICLAGKNGSGKSCFMKAIAGILKIDDGYVRVNGVDIAASPIEKRDILMVAPDSFFAHLDVESHIRWGARLRRVVLDKDRVSKVKADLGIDFGGPVRKLSLGMRERVSLATALLTSPRVILVDEAFSNLHDRDAFILSYKKLAVEAGIDLIFSTQDASDGRLADHTYIMSAGTATKQV